MDLMPLSSTNSVSRHDNRFDAIPLEMKTLTQWLVWKNEEKDGKPTKIPYNPRTHTRAKSNDWSTWGTFSEAYSTLLGGGYEGLGFVFTPPYIGIDYDDVRNPYTGEVTTNVCADIELLESYTEISPSGTGLHVICKGTIPGDKRRIEGFEIYSEGRFFTITGERIEGTPTTINSNQSSIERVYRERFGLSRVDSPLHSDDLIIELCKRGKSSTKFSELWDGDIAGYPSQSEADLALIGIISFFTDNRDQIDRIFRRSKLFRPKWDQNRGSTTYGELTINKGVERSPNIIGHDKELPKIVITNTRLRDLTQSSLDAVVRMNTPPNLFVRSRNMVRIGYDEQGNPIIEHLTKYGVRGLLERAAEYYREKSTGDRIPVPPHMDIVDDLCNLPDWPLPVLSGVIECPCILPDNTLIASPGYDSNTRLYYAPMADLILPFVPEIPSQEDVIQSIEMLKEIFCDFPFAGKTNEERAANEANVIAALITAVLRPGIKGRVPIGIIDKPQAGTGATLLASLISLVSTGREGSMMPAPSDDEGWRKLITSILMQGRTIVICDNIERKLYAPALAAAITSDSWQDRILGRNEMVNLKQDTFWLATGNNIQLGGDMPRRCFWIRLDAQTARPWQRTDYKHPQLLEWVKENRGRILSAVLTLARSWILVGKPKPTGIPVIGGFEEWRDTIGGILQNCGVEHFLGNLERMYDETDGDTPQWEAFLEKWQTIWAGPVTVSDVVKHLERESNSTFSDSKEDERLVDFLPDTLHDEWVRKKGFSRALGRALSKINGRVFKGGLRIENSGLRNRAVKWMVTVSV